jgi:hypothetical protein
MNTPLKITTEPHTLRASRTLERQPATTVVSQLYQILGVARDEFNGSHRQPPAFL